MFALVDAEYNYKSLDVGCQGRILNVGCQGRMSGGGIFKETELYRKLENNSLNLPALKHCKAETK